MIIFLSIISSKKKLIVNVINLRIKSLVEKLNISFEAKEVT
jgi:hypothetical protein